MFLKSLTLRGFKSFAERTVLDFEPGITVIVGPNGSGKSNVVDALSWVLGTRSAKLLRGGELADVIFAGSPSRPAQSHAKVEITIDNSRGQLGSGAVGLGGSAQEFSEVRISREILATGENHYAINGVECRLLDVQELLSDTGLGRELHTIVGQGQLDAILHAKPEERRAFVEEAAGILKHRRRRERAVRKLDQVELHVEKLRTVLRELRRQLKPLERQAEAANRHADLQAQLRDVQVRIAAHDLVELRGRWGRVVADDDASREHQRELEEAATALGTTVSELERDLRASTPDVERARDVVEQLRRLRERLGGTAGLVDARRRHLLEFVEEPLAGRPPDELRAQADRLDEDVHERGSLRADAAERLEVATARSLEAQLARRDHERRRQEEARLRARAREAYLRWENEARSRESAVAAAEAEASRLDDQLADLDARTESVAGEVEEIQSTIQRLDAEEWHLTEAVEDAETELASAEVALDVATAHERELERERASQAARAEALRAASGDAGDGAAALLGSELDGILGLLADHVRIAGGAEEAVAAALGPLGEAIAARSPEHARNAVNHLRDSRNGRAIVLAARDGADHDDHGTDIAGAEPLARSVSPRDGSSVGVVNAVRRALSRSYLAPSWEAAVALHGAHPDLTFVTRQGDVAGPLGYAGGSAPERSAVLLAAAAEEAERRVGELTEELVAARGAASSARDVVAARRDALAAATATINESDARITGAAEQLARLNKELEGLARQRDVIDAQRAELLATADRHRTTLEQLRDEAVAPVDGHEVDPEPDAEADQLDADVEAARRSELDARLAVERIDEQLRHLRAAAADLRREADDVERALAEAARRRELRRIHIRRCGELAAICEAALAELDTSIVAAEAERDELAQARRRTEVELDRVREELAAATASLDEVREERHAADLRRADLRHEVDQVEQRLRDDFGLPPDDVLGEHPDAAAYERGDLAQLEDTLVRKLGLLGRVNPLALEEFRALEERHGFLSGQLDDLLSSRRDLEEVIEAVDRRIEEVFAEAFADVAREFADVFATVFPGGEGRLVLTEPDDLLTTGIEVEARPPGKRVRRLSLLSGGERSLTALALLFAIFRARPSPFYVLDEVEAALDDVNLQRLLAVIESFKEHSQLLVVTHQKRTMEVADVLYGVTMGRDAVSKVVAERMREPTSA